MKKILRWLKRRSRKQKLLLFLANLLLALGVFFYFWIFYDLPSIDNIEAGLVLPSTRIYDRNGVLLYEILPPMENEGRNTAIPLAEIPQHCINAAIATEDENYYRHPGVDIIGIARALWINVRGGEVLAGGSTITQQTARLLLLDPQQRLERTLRRKLRESVLAIRLQNAYGKDRVLELYLNQSYFGNLAYGIEAAAQTYFAKSAPELSLAECALLTGLLQNPTLYDPFTRADAAKTRQEVVLGLMTESGSITEADAQAAAGDDLQFAAAPFPIAAPHLVMAVWTQLEREYPEYIYGGGLEVTTTIDLDWTNAAQEIVQQQLDQLNHPLDASRPSVNANNAALVAMDPFTGQVLTMLGSPDYFDETIDGAVNAALALRQPGSALKPFTYAAAMNPELPEPYTAATMLLDVRTPFITRRLESYTPANYALVEHGPVLVREALASSYNIPAVVALDHVGIDNMIRLAGSAGLQTLVENPRLDLAVTLGGGEVRLLDLVQAYSIFPNGGYRIEPTLLLRVATHDGAILYEWQPPAWSTRVLDERVAYIITDILSDNEARMPSFGPNSVLNIGRPAAAKTGTTTNFRDNWVVGYTPNLVVGVWVGNADNTPMLNITGVSGAGPIWHQFMRRALRGQPELEFARPEGLVEVEICALSGLLPTAACPLRRTDIFIPGTVPTEADNLYQVFTIDAATGALAAASTPPERRLEQVFIVLPQEAQEWGYRHGIRQPPTGAAVQLSDTNIGARILYPDPYSVFQISLVTPIETQRLRFRAAAPEGAVTVTYTLNDQTLGPLTEPPYSYWWTLAVGDYTLTATATLADGANQESAPVEFHVTEYAAPESHNVGP